MTTQGTPKTLREAIKNALGVGPLTEVEASIEAHVRDFLAQKFGVAYLIADDPTLLLLEDLYFKITGKLTVKSEN